VPELLTSLAAIVGNIVALLGADRLITELSGCIFPGLFEHSRMRPSRQPKLQPIKFFENRRRLGNRFSAFARKRIPSVPVKVSFNDWAYKRAM
jgi:hypothetical protein